MSQSLDALIMTLGFEPGPLVRAVASYNLRPGAFILVFTPSFKDERAEKAYLELKKICDMVFKGFQVELRKVEVDLTDFVKAVRQVKEILSGLTDKQVALCFTGGMRALCFAVYTAYLMLRWKQHPTVEAYLEGRVERLTIPPLSRIVRVDVTEEKLAVLRLIHQHERLSANNIAVLMRKNRSTIYRHLASLAEDGLARQRGRMYELTDLGLMLM